MGMDVYGVQPTEDKEVGKYFRRNVWGWRPLWQYMEIMHKDIADFVAHPDTNDGDGLNRLQSEALCKRLRNDIETGMAQKYIEARNEYLSELERPQCDLCSGTGIRTDQIGVEHGMPEKELSPEMAMLTGRSHGYCNACSGEGKKDAWETNYYLDIDDIKEFADFLEHCGGFEIH